MKRFKSLVIFVLILSLGLMSGCQKYQKDIYERNEKIAEQGDSYTFAVRIGNTYSDKMNAKFSGFYGMETTWSIDAKEDSTVTMEVNAEITKGRFKVVLISPDNEVSIIFEGSKKDSIELKLEKGKSRIKIVGDEAKGNIEMSIDEGDNVKVSKH